MSLPERTRPRLGIVEPCLPSPAKAPPSGPDWIHEIKHDGFRIMARRDGAGVRLFSRNGHDFTSRFPLVAAAVTAPSMVRPSSLTTTDSRYSSLPVPPDKTPAGPSYAPST
jgi:ATP-dependent DNA ligase